MSVPAWLSRLSGSYEGPNRVWLAPGQPARESAAAADVASIAQGRFITVTYSWADEGRPQDGLLLLGENPGLATWSATWVDSWHMGDVAMTLEGTPVANETISVRGGYAAPPGPDWGWRIVVSPRGPDGFDVRMYNITPEGEEALAVEARFTRA